MPDMKFESGQTVWSNGSGLAYKVLASEGKALWIINLENSSVAIRHDATDFTATDPNTKPLPQKCPFCGSAPRDLKNYQRYYYSCGNCKLCGPDRSTDDESIAAWNSIRIGPTVCAECCDRKSLDVNCFCQECYDMLHGDEFGKIGKTDDASLTEEWLRKVGLCDWQRGLRGPFQFEPPHPGGVTVHYKLSGQDAELSDYVCIRTTCKTIGDARQLCRLLGVTLKE